MGHTTPKVDLLKRAVTEQRKISDRAEKQSLDDHRRLFVDNARQNFVSKMVGLANQVVFGRRGTGKTMLLKELLQAGRPFNTNGDYIAIMVQVPDFLRSPDVTEKDPPVVRARSFFREFLYQFANELMRIHDDVLKNEDFLARVGLKNKSARLVLSDRVLRLSHTLQHGVRTYRVDSKTFKERLENSEQDNVEGGSEMQFNVEGDVGVKSGYPSAKIAVTPAFSEKSSSERSRSRKVFRTEDVVGDYDFGMPEIREGLRDILKMIRTDQIMILLDEWQALSLDCQSEFAHLLNRCFFGIECVSVKIAAYRHVCHFNNGGSRENFRGLELGQDIEVVGDTDLPPAEDNTKKFFFDILYRRLLYMEPDLEKHYGDPTRFDYTILLDDVFRNRHVADMLVRGCHGVSRDFIKAFNFAAEHSEDDIGRQKITLDAVNMAHGELSREVQENVHTADDIGGLLFEMIKPHTNRTGKPYFFIRETEHQWDSLLWELVEKRAIHVVPEASMPAGASVEWKGFEVSYGLFQRWSTAWAYASGGKTPQMKWSDVSQMLPEEFESHILQFMGGPSSMRTCVACKEQFSSTSHSFMVKRLCPICYADQGN